MLFNLQALRGIAALLVVMFHSLPHFKAMGLSSPVFEFFAGHGNIGVDIFFVISGYVMAKTTSGSAHNFDVSVHFVSKRFARIYLGYWPIYLLALVVYYLHNPDYLLGKELFHSFILVYGSYSELLITPAWSLTYELYFYLIVGLMLSSDSVRPIPAFATISLLVILKSIFIQPGENTILDLVFSPYLFEFIFGYLIFYYWQYISARKWVFVSFVFGTLFLSLGVQLEDSIGYFRFAAFCAFSVCFVWLMILLEKHELIIFSGWIKKVGDSSYTLYLSHTILLGLFYTLGIRDYLVANHVALPGLMAFIVLIIFVSWMFYIFVEAPLYRSAKRQLKQMPLAG